jgi:hypothetical protein
MQVPNLGEKNEELASPAGYGLGDALSRATPKKRQSCPLPQGNSVPLIVPKSGIHFPLTPEGGFPMKGEFIGNSPESNRFTFGLRLLV